MQIKKVQKKETKIGQINRKNLPRLLVLGFLFAFVLTSLAFVALVTYRKRSIPKDWSVYSNKYYGYSVFYDPNQFFVQTDSYGPESGEDISIIINKINRASFNGRDSTEVIKNLLQ